MSSPERRAEQLARLEGVLAALDSSRSGRPSCSVTFATAPAAERSALAGPQALVDKRRATRRLLATLGPTSTLEDWWVAHSWMLVDALEKGDRAQVDIELDACRRLATNAANPAIPILTHMWEATTLLLFADFGAAEQHIVLALAAADDAEVASGGLAAQLAFLAWERGDADGAADHVGGVVGRSHLQRAILADLLAENGRREEASLELDRLALDGFSHVPRDRDWLPAMTWIARACCRLERDDLARRLRALLAPVRDRLVVAGGLPCLVLGAVSHYTGALAVMNAEPDVALVDLAAAADLYGDLGARGWLVSTRCEQVRALLSRRDPGDALTAERVLDEAGREAVDLGATRLTEKVALLRGDPPSVRTVAPTFCKEDGGWRLAFDSRPVHLADTKGMRALHHLLGRPGVAVAATTIATDVLNDAADDPERARVNVTRQIRTAIDRIGEYAPELSGHLSTTVLTGRACEYRVWTEPPAWNLRGE